MSRDLSATGKMFSDTSPEDGLLARNIRHLMHVKKIDAQCLSKETGIALTTINGLRRGYGNPTLSTIKELAKFFKVSIGALTEKEISQTENELSKVFEIPLLELDEVDNLTQHTKKSKERATITTELENYFNLENMFCIKIKNNSMSPFFSKNTIFVITNDDNIHDGDMVLVRFGNNLPCIRQVFIEGESYFFKVIPEKNERNMLKSDKFEIIGIVIKAIQTITER